jgi:hypothetical protein
LASPHGETSSQPAIPQLEKAWVVADLYVEVGAVAMALIQEKVKRTKETL